MSIRPYKNISPKLADSVFVDPSAVVIGDVEIGADSSVWPMAAIRGDTHHIRIGQRTNIQDGSVLHTDSPRPKNPDGFPLTIGDNVTVGHRAVLHGCTIHNLVLIGMGSIILDGATIESQVIIAAGSLVSSGKTIQSGGLYLGSPAKRVRELTEQEMSFFTSSADDYVNLKNQY